MAPDDREPKLSRSKLLAGTGAAAAGLSLAQADPAGAQAGQLGIATEDRNALEFVFKVDQVGARFTTYGYVTHIAGLPASALFSANDPRNERTARFTLQSATTMQNRSILEGVHALDVTGPLEIFLRDRAGANFDAPDSFRQGRLIASYAGTFQSIVNVIAPARGIETLEGSLRQTAAERFRFRGASRILGRRGLRLRVNATGFGTLLEPQQPRAVLLLAGNAVVAR